MARYWAVVTVVQKVQQLVAAMERQLAVPLDVRKVENWAELMAAQLVWS